MIRKLLSFAWIIYILLSSNFKGIESTFDEKLKNITIIAQNSDTFVNSEKPIYKQNYFFANGCRPSSVINSLTLAFEYENDTNEFQLVSEGLNLFSSSHNPKKYSIDNKNLKFLDLKEDTFLKENSSDYPVTYNMVNGFNGIIDYIGKNLNQEIISKYLKTNCNKILIGNGNPYYNTTSLIEITEMLYKKGFFDSNIIYASIGVGTNTCSGPFRLGKAGHYACFLFNVKDYYENGIFYLVDSYPRAIENEEISDIYRQKYDFANPKYKLEMKNFNSTYRATRITPCILKLCYLPEVLKELKALTNEKEIACFHVKNFQKSISLNSEGIMIVSIKQHH